MIYKLKKNINELGTLNGVLYSLGAALKFLPIKSNLHKYYFVSQKISATPLMPEGKGKSISIVEIPKSETPHPCPRPQEVISSRYKQGATCLAAYREEQFLGCLWYVPEQYIEDEVRCLFKLTSKTSVWDFDVYVVPKHRLSPVFLKLWDHASKTLLQKGYHSSISRISAFNAMSLSSHKRMGAKTLGSAIFLSIGNFQLTISSLPPLLNFSWGERQRATIDLNSQE